MLSDRAATTEFVCGMIQKKRPVRCPGCGFHGHWLMSDGSIRCRKCEKDYSAIAGTRMAPVRIGLRRWLILVRMFVRELPATQASEEAGVSYPTAPKSFDIMRQTILAHLARTEGEKFGVSELDEAYFGGRRKGNRGRMTRTKIPVFGIRERSGRACVRVVRNVRASTLLKGTLRKVRKGSLVYTDKWGGCDTLVMAGFRRQSVNHSVRFGRGRVHINGLEGFWSYAKQMMAKFRGVSREKFPLYLREMEWRYNNQGRDLTAILLGWMLEAPRGRYAGR